MPSERNKILLPHSCFLSHLQAVLWEVQRKNSTKHSLSHTHSSFPLHSSPKDNWEVLPSTNAAVSKWLLLHPVGEAVPENRTLRIGQPNPKPCWQIQATWPALQLMQTRNTTLVVLSVWGHIHPLLQIKHQPLLWGFTGPHQLFR